MTGVVDGVSLLLLNQGWDGRTKGPGRAMAAAAILELGLGSNVRVQGGKIEVIAPATDTVLEGFAQKLAALGRPTPTEALAKLDGAPLLPFLQRLQERGQVRLATRKTLGLFPKTEALLLDRDGATRTEQKIIRVMVGGTPEAEVILLLGVAEAAGLLSSFMAPGALASSQKRIRGLLTGRDTLGYLVDRRFKAMQGALVEGVLGALRSGR